MRSLSLTLTVLLIATTALAKPINVMQEDDFWVFGEGTSERTFTITEPMIRADRRSNESATLLTRKEYENFRLTFELQHNNDCELILSLHAPRNGAYAAGQEIVLSEHPDMDPGLYTAGAMLGREPGLRNPIKRYGAWNDVEVLMDWPQLTVTINGKVVQDLNLDEHDELRYTLRRGQIAFRDLLGWGFTLRNVKLEELGDKEYAKKLFDGETLRGWKEVRTADARWRVEDNAIMGDDGDGYLQHELLCQDFDLRLYYITTPTANGGVFFRWKSDDSERGDEIQILDVPDSVSPSGSIYNIQRANGSSIRPDQWNLLQIRVEGERAVTHINGVRAAATESLENVWPGHITLQMHKDGTTIWFRDLYLLNLDTDLFEAE